MYGEHADLSPLYLVTVYILSGLNQCVLFEKAVDSEYWIVVLESSTTRRIMNVVRAYMPQPHQFPTHQGKA